MNTGTFRWVVFAGIVLVVFILSAAIGAGIVALLRSPASPPDAPNPLTAADSPGPEPAQNELPTGNDEPPPPSTAGMAFIPAGSFSMGASDELVEWQLALCNHFVEQGGDEIGCQLADFTDQLPAHSVFLDAFYLDLFEVTNADYRACVEAEVCAAPDPGAIEEYLEPNYATSLVYETYPVVGVSQADAAAYCGWVGKRLPSEAEWERAARGDDQRLFPWGTPSLALDQSIEQLRAATWVNYCDADCLLNPEAFAWVDADNRDGYGGPAPVGSYAPGPFGVHDLAGNVQEWVQDFWSQDFYQASPTNDPVNLSQGDLSSSVTRGGGWNSGLWFSAATHRWGVSPDRTRAFIGFRCAADG